MIKLGRKLLFLSYFFVEPTIVSVFWHFFHFWRNGGDEKGHGISSDNFVTMADTRSHITHFSSLHGVIVFANGECGMEVWVDIHINRQVYLC